MLVLSLLLLYFCGGGVFSESIEEDEISFSESITRKDAGFFFTMPRILTYGVDEMVCLSMHNILLPTKSIIDMQIKGKHYITKKTIETEHTCFEITIPSLKHVEPSYVDVQVQVQINETVESSQNQDPILVYPNRNTVFLQTDRQIYKPGDVIKIRLLALNKDLFADSTFKVNTVKIRNPNGITTLVWDNVQTQMGLVHLEYQLSNETVEGNWTIETNKEKKVVQVRRYTLPRFKVDINHTKSFYVKAKEMIFRICGNYPYGQPVKGTAVIKISLKNSSSSISRLKQLHLGCADFQFSPRDLNLTADCGGFCFYRHSEVVIIEAVVTESGTGQSEVNHAEGAIEYIPYKINFKTNDPFFRSGLPFSGLLELYDVYEKPENEIIQLCYTFSVKRPWNIKDIRPCANFTISDNNSVPFTIPPLKHSVIHLDLWANPLQNALEGLSKQYFRFHSPTSNYLYLQQNMNDDLKCQSHQHFLVMYTVNRANENHNLTFYYMVKSNNKILKLRKIIKQPQKSHTTTLKTLHNVVGGKHKFTKFGTTFDTFPIKFKLDNKVLTKYQLLVYYVLLNGDVIGDSREVNIEPCLSNKVHTEWLHNQIHPGYPTTFSIKTSPSSLCSLSVIDEATKFRYSANFNLRNLIDYFTEEKLDWEDLSSSRMSCVKHIKKPPLETQQIFSYEYLRRRKRESPESYDADTAVALKKYGAAIITNLRILTKPCVDFSFMHTTDMPPTDENFIRTLVPPRRDNAPTNIVAETSELSYSDHNSENIAPIRNFFPETWLWELIPVSQNGEVKIEKNTPHSITKWTSNALCISPTDGLGLSETLSIVTFQPFFVDVIAPYSIKRGETLHLHFKIFNYLNNSLPVRFNLFHSEGLEILGESLSKNSSRCIKGGESLDHVYRVRSTEVGILNLTVVCDVDPSYPQECGPEFIIYKRDVVSKLLLVEPEGFPVETVKSALMCSNDTVTQNITWIMELPYAGVVPDTERSRVLITADLLASTIENLDKLLLIPTGCGEQILSTLAPNLYILRYLNATKTLSPATRNKAIKNLKIGYQRILVYAHKDGSFSAFGKYDPSGSMFLTAFVVRTLVQAKPYIYVDDNVINKAIRWIYEHQLENGCFATMFHVFQDMGGASKENSTASLTAYVLISLLEADISIPEAVLTNAKYCIRGYHAPDKYTLAISAYTLLLVDWHSEAEKYLDKIIRSFLLTNHTEESASSSDIEIMGYILLSLLHQNDRDNMVYASQIVRWLSTQLSPRGAFKSTQDTVVALDALTKFSVTAGMKVNAKVRLLALNQDEEITIGDEDRLKTKKIDLKEADNTVHLSITGQGCLLAQVILAYNVHSLAQSQAFTLNVDVSPVSTTDHCSVNTINPCVTYTGPDLTSNMAVMEIGLPSGYQPNRASLYQLLDAPNSKVKRFEEEENQVVLYFTKLSSEQICAPFVISESNKIENHSNSTIKIYDYYKPEFEASEVYKIKGCDKSDTPIPQLEASSTINPEITPNFTSVTKMTGLNPDFVNMDVEMAIPEGMEGNRHVYVSPDESQSKRKTAD